MLVKIKCECEDDVLKDGVYKIINRVNNKYYIGSTVDTFIKRLNHHYHALLRGTHKNSHLQRAWNKYGEDSFDFVIVEICDASKARDLEQVYLDNIPEGMGYNINKQATGPCFEEETLKKQVDSRRKFYSECLPYYTKIKNGEITMDEVPKKYRQKIQSYLDQVPWNKNKKYKSTEHLKVRHKKSDRSNVKNTVREKCPIVYVYSKNKNFLGSFRSSKDLEELSESLNLPIKSRFKSDRLGVPVKHLQSANINKAAKNGTTYKGLYFYNEPLHPGKDDVDEPKSVKSWNANTEVTEEIKKSSALYSVETETVKTE